MSTAGEIVYNIPTDGTSLPEGPLAVDLVPCSNVLHHGAVGDGTTDDTVAFQAAADAAATGNVLSARRGCDFYMPEGDYKITAKVTFKPGTRIRGAGMNLTRILSYVSNDDLFYFNADDTTANVAKPIAFEDFCVLGRVASTGSYLRVTGVLQSNRPLFRNLYLYGNQLGTYGARFNNTINLVADNVIIQGMTSHGFFGEATNNCGTFLSTYSLNNLGCGYKLRGTEMSLISTASDQNASHNYDLTLVASSLLNVESEYAGGDLIYLRECSAVSIYTGYMVGGTTNLGAPYIFTTGHGITVDGGTLVMLLNLYSSASPEATGFTFNPINATSGLVVFGGYFGAFGGGTWGSTADIAIFRYDGMITTNQPIYVSEVHVGGYAISFGANDSAGAGFRTVKIANTA